MTDSSKCPLCGWDTPHSHSPTEQTIYHNGVKHGMNLTDWQGGWRLECDGADSLLRLLGLHPDQCRTEGGALNIPKVRSLLQDGCSTPSGETKS